MHYNTFPNSPTIILLHDSLGCIDLWRQFPEQLSTKTQCNVLVYDRLGYGKSDKFINKKREQTYMELEADWLNDIIGYFELEKVILFGHSDGASIALITAAKYPKKICAVITEGAHVFVEDITIDGIKEAITQYENNDLKFKLEQYHGEKTEALFWAWANTWTQPFFKTWNIEHFLSEITCPVLVIQGTDDEYGTLAQVESIARNVKAYVKKLVLKDVGHTPHKAVTDRILIESNLFLNSLNK